MAYGYYEVNSGGGQGYGPYDASLTDPLQRRRGTRLGGLLATQLGAPGTGGGLGATGIGTPAATPGLPPSRPSPMGVSNPNAMGGGALGGSRLLAALPQPQAMAPNPMAPTPTTPGSMPVPGTVDYTKNAGGQQTATVPPPTPGAGTPNVKATDAVNSQLAQLLGENTGWNTLLANLEYQGQGGNLNDLVQNHASEFADTNRYFDQASQKLQQDLAQRGMGDSTAFGTGMGAVEGQRASGLGELSQKIHAEELAREDAAHQQLMQAHTFLSGLLSEIANQKANRKMSKWQTRKQIQQMQEQQMMQFIATLAGKAGQVAGGAAAGGGAAAPSGFDAGPAAGPNASYGF